MSSLTFDVPSSSPPPPPSSSTPPPPSLDSPPTSQTTSPPPPPKDEPPPPSSSSPPPLSSSSPPPPPSDKESSSDKQPPPPSNDNNNSKPQNNENLYPPPSHSTALTPPGAKSTPSKVDRSSDNNIFVLAGAGLILLLIIILLVSCYKRRKRKHQEMKYYRDNFNKVKGNGYWQSSEHTMRMQSGKQANPEYGWSAQPPPMMSTSEHGSAKFSGQPHPLAPPRSSMTLGSNQSSFSYEELAAATGGFSQANLLGQGGFGYVHKGILPNGKEVAVKSLKANSGQGEREFQAEVDIISRVHHRYLVSLVGYCITGSQRMLVYEFVSNNTLEYHLHGTGRPVMDWPTRLKIALGSAKGFAYLHEDCHPRIIHRDIKVANILLDDNFDAQVADFGLAKLSTGTNTHVSTRIMGTFGYMAPEYASSGKLTEKSDVYSYGVVLLELITGKRPIDIHSEDVDTLVEWARPILLRIINDGDTYEEIVDPQLDGNYDPQEMLAMLACAEACTRHSGRRRPKMSQVVRALEGDMSIDALKDDIRHTNSSRGSEYGSQSDLRKLAKSAGLLSEDFTSSEKGMTNEF